jgi:sec-independent protein translocase protein TatB
MEILGISPQELVFVIIIALIVLGPKDMQKAGRTIGRWLNGLVRSDGWKAFQQTSRELRNLPNTLMREANMEMAKTEKDLQKALDIRPAPLPARSASPNPPGSSSSLPQPPETENSIQPPPATNTKASESAPASDEPNHDDGKVSTSNQDA